MGLVFTFLALLASSFFLLGYIVATARMTKHLRSANDLNQSLLTQLRATTEDPADWWKNDRKQTDDL